MSASHTQREIEVDRRVVIIQVGEVLSAPITLGFGGRKQSAHTSHTRMRRTWHMTHSLHLPLLFSRDGDRCRAWEGCREGGVAFCTSTNCG
mmetsp:Transcript_38099/g.95432  ORF Transcript_38099/g.95432 Transcript_38099/m.95432 type:complete len:91 (+) Transcript_38099:181-453(+)